MRIFSLVSDTLRMIAGYVSVYLGYQPPPARLTPPLNDTRPRSWKKDATNPVSKTRLISLQPNPLFTDAFE